MYFTKGQYNLPENLKEAFMKASELESSLCCFVFSKNQIQN